MASGGGNIGGGGGNIGGLGGNPGGGGNVAGFGGRPPFNGGAGGGGAGPVTSNLSFYFEISFRNMHKNEKNLAILFFLFKY